MRRDKEQSSSGERRRKPRTDYSLRYIDPNGVTQDEPYSSTWSVETKAFLNAQNLKALFFSEDWVFISVDAYAQPISSLPLVVVRKGIEDEQEVEKVVPFHPVSQLLESPNPHVDGTQLKYSLTCDYVLGGNCFLYFAKTNKQAFHVSFDRVQYQFDKAGLPLKYIIYPDSEEIIPNITNGVSVELNEMAHVRRPNPSSPLWGLSPFIAGRRSVLFNRYSQDYLNSFYLKGASPQFILEMEQTANEQSVLRLLRSFEIAHTGRRNQRRTMLLPKGVKATAADHKIADQQITELIKLNRETILNTLHIPKHVVSLQEAGSLGSEEHKMALKYFWSTALLPTCNAIASSLTKFFRKQGLLAVNEELSFDTSSIAILQDDLKANAETANLLLSTHTLNEVRAQVFGLPPLIEGDVIKDMQQMSFNVSADQSITSSEAPLDPETIDQADTKPAVEKMEIAKTALNGAQVASLIEVVQNVALGNLPRESGVAIIQVSFQLSAQEAEAVMGSVGRDFNPENPEQIEQKSVDENDDGFDMQEKSIPAKYEGIDFKPPEDVAEEAKRGLELRQKYGRGGTEVGVARAVQLKNRRTVAPDTIIRMASYFARHNGEADNKESNGEPTAGAIAWKLWGGDAGRRWSEKVKGQMQSADEKEKGGDASPNVIVMGSQGESQPAKPVSMQAPETKELPKYHAQLKANDETTNGHLKRQLPKMVDWSLSLNADMVDIAIKALKDSKSLKEVPSARELRKRIKKASNKLKQEYLTKFNETLSSSMDFGYEIQTQLIFDKPSREAIAAASMKDEKGRRETLEARGLKAFASIDDTITEDIMGVIEDGMKNNLSVDAISKNIIKKSGEISKSRAMTIARTETLTAVSIGNWSMLQTAKAVVPNMKKAWITASDDDVRSSHRGLNGKIIDPDEKFQNGLRYPRDPEGGADEVINCRCTMLTLPPDDIEQYQQELAEIAAREENQ